MPAGGSIERGGVEGAAREHRRPPLRITNLDKVLYPETGTTKGEVIDYYTRIGPTMIPHVTGDR
jgi:bifunctional non-homologous end joining protein LigD